MSKNMAEPLFEFLKKYALSLDQHRELKRYCDEIGIQYMCTPFSYKAAEELVEARLLNVIKIGSGEMTDIPSLEKMTNFGLPMIISTGMCELGEIAETYNALMAKGAKVIERTKLFDAPETWSMPALSRGLLYVQQNEPGRDGTKPRLICYDLRAK